MTPKQLKKAFKQLPELPPKAPRFTWLRRQQEIRRHVERQDVKNFLRWSTMIETMFVGNAPYIDKEYRSLSQRYLNAIHEPKVGNPELYKNWTSGNLVHQAYHLMQWEQLSGKRVEKLGSIVEIGGGYGAMCLICRRLGFEGQYAIIDLPEFNLLQRYYLSNTVGDNGVTFGYPEYVNNDLCICLWSVSEVPENKRNFILTFSEFYHSFLFAYAPRWDGVNNTRWFEEFANDRNDLIWQDWRIEHLPNSRYRVGYVK